MWKQKAEEKETKVKDSDLVFNDGFTIAEGTNQEHRFLCQLCFDPVYVSTLTNNALQSGNQHLFWWEMRLQRFFKKHAIASFFAKASPTIFLLVSILLPFIGVEIQLTAIPLTLFLISYAITEYVPLSPTPFSPNNAFTNNETKYVGGARAVFSTLIVGIVFSFGLFLIHIFFDELFTKDLFYQAVTSLLSIFIIALPTVFLFYVQISTWFKDVPMKFPINPNYEDESGVSNVDLVKHAINKLQSNQKPWARRMVKFYNDRGGHYQLSSNLAKNI